MSTSAVPAASGREDRALRGTALVSALVFVTLVLAVIASLGAPLITAVALDYGVSLTAAQWTLTITLLVGAVVTPLLGRIGSYWSRRSVVLVTLALVTLGSLATAVPAPFWVLLIGRALQGAGLGLPVLMMATARDHLGDRAPGTIAMLSVTGTAGIGVGYPVSGLLVQAGGVHLAYLLGVVFAAAALVTAALVLPSGGQESAKRERVDWLGATLLSLALVAVLLVTSQVELWISDPAAAGLILAAGLVLLFVWVLFERRVTRPLVDLAALRHPAVAGANLVMFVSGIAMYLLFTLVTRYVQTPDRVGYGYGLTQVESGLVLVPFSLLGFVAGRQVPKLRNRVGPFTLLVVGGLVTALACVLFAVSRTGSVVWPVLVMAVLGFGVGGFSATMPQAILAITPAEETAAAMSLNQVLRAVSFSIGSAVSALMLAAYTPAGGFLPVDPGYSAAAWVAAALAMLTTALAAVVGVVCRRRVLSHQTG